MESLAGPVAIAAVTLVLAGAQKLFDPASTRGALRAMGLPWRGIVVPLLAIGEIATGVLVLVDGSAPALAALAAWYLGFTVFVVVALRRSVPLASCGCLGRPDTPPTVAHLGFDIACLVVAVAVAIDPYGSLADVLADQPWAGVPFVLWVGIGVYASYLLLAVLPQALVAMRVRRTSVGVA